MSKSFSVSSVALPFPYELADDAAADALAAITASIAASCATTVAMALWSNAVSDKPFCSSGSCHNIPANISLCFNVTLPQNPKPFCFDNQVLTSVISSANTS